MESFIESGKVLVAGDLRVAYQALQGSSAAIERSRQLIARSDQTVSDLRNGVLGSHVAARIS